MGLIRIAITGPESSGKSDLTKALAGHYQCPMATEYAREFLGHTGGVYTQADLQEIWKQQMLKEETAAKSATDLVFFDTDVLVVKIWSLFRFGNVPFKVDQANASRSYGLRLLCKPDLPWQPDPFRESPDQAERDLLFALFEKQLISMGAPYVVIEGQGDARLHQAIMAIEQHLALI